MYGAVGFGCGIIGQGIANLILTAKWYGFLSRVCFTLIGSTSLGEEKVKIGQNWPKNCYSKQRLIKLFNEILRSKKMLDELRRITLQEQGRYSKSCKCKLPRCKTYEPHYEIIRNSDWA